MLERKTSNVCLTAPMTNKCCGNTRAFGKEEYRTNITAASVVRHTKWLVHASRKTFDSGRVNKSLPGWHWAVICPDAMQNVKDKDNKQLSSYCKTAGHLQHWMLRTDHLEALVCECIDKIITHYVYHQTKNSVVNRKNTRSFALLKIQNILEKSSCSNSSVKDSWWGLSSSERSESASSSESIAGHRYKKPC